MFRTCCHLISRTLSIIHHLTFFKVPAIIADHSYIGNLSLIWSFILYLDSDSLLSSYTWKVSLVWGYRDQVIRKSHFHTWNVHKNVDLVYFRLAMNAAAARYVLTAFFLVHLAYAMANDEFCGKSWTKWVLSKCFSFR